MSLPSPPSQYSAADQQRLRGVLEQRDSQNRKKQTDLVIAPDEHLIMTDTVTGGQVSITVASGALVVTPL